MAQSACFMLAPTGVDPARRYRGEDGSSHESSCSGRDRMVRNGEISARNSARGSERVPRSEKGPAGTRCPDWPCECRGDWIRTSDLLNPIQKVAGRKIARASRFTAYRSHTSHILRSGAHKIHGFRGVSCSFLQSETPVLCAAVGFPTDRFDGSVEGTDAPSKATQPRTAPERLNGSDAMSAQSGKMA
jgi:hypothetical protein